LKICVETAVLEVELKKFIPNANSSFQISIAELVGSPLVPILHSLKGACGRDLYVLNWRHYMGHSWISLSPAMIIEVDTYS